MRNNDFTGKASRRRKWWASVSKKHLIGIRIQASDLSWDLVKTHFHEKWIKEKTN